LQKKNAFVPLFDQAILEVNETKSSQMAHGQTQRSAFKFSEKDEKAELMDSGSSEEKQQNDFKF